MIRTQISTMSRTLILLLTLVSLCSIAIARYDNRAHKNDEKRKHETKIERSLATDSQVVVSICVASGNIKVAGWSNNEVRVSSVEAGEIELKRKDEGTGAPRKLDVRVRDKQNETGSGDPCDAYSDIEVNVPRGATVQLQSRDSDINVENVSVVYANTQNGNVDIEGATRVVEAATIGGGISLRDSTGRIYLHSAGGSIEAINLRPLDSTDLFEARSLGGGILLDHVRHSQVSAHTLNGSLEIERPLASHGRYNFRPMSGDLTVSLPADSSFQVSARYSQGAEVITDFPITLQSLSSVKPIAVASPGAVTAPASVAVQAPVKPVPSPHVPPSTPPDPKAVPPEEGADGMVKVKTKKGMVVVDMAGLSMRRIEGVCGTGDAKLELASFSGTIHLQKQ